MCGGPLESITPWSPGDTKAAHPFWRPHPVHWVCLKQICHVKTPATWPTVESMVTEKWLARQPTLGE